MAKQTGVYRIIGGQWRGRKIPIPKVDGVRPTPDRVRETLFNWLALEIHDTHCLDAFAGSGALGVEALSRGAARVDFIERSAVVSRHLTRQLEGGMMGRVITGDFLTASVTGPYDIIFLDPPFRQGLLPEALAKAVRLLAPSGVIYMECERELALSVVAGRCLLRLLKHKMAGQLQFGLVGRG